MGLTQKLPLVLLVVVTVIVFLSGCILSGCEVGEEDVPKPTMSLPEKSAKVSVFYATGNTLVEEKHVVPDDASIIKSTLNELLAAKPLENSDIAIVQPECKVISASVNKKGLVTINFDRQVLLFDALPKEKKLAYLAILQTLKQFKNVKAIRFVVEGRDSGTIIGKDIQGFWGNVTLKNQPWQLR